MTYFEAYSMKQDFVAAMQYAGAFEETRDQAFKKAVEKYSVKQLNDAYLALKERHKKEMDGERALFPFAADLKKAGDGRYESAGVRRRLAVRRSCDVI